MTELRVGDKVRVNEGLLENQTGYITGIDVEKGVTYVSLEDTAFGGGDLAFYTDTLVSAEKPHPALEAVKLYPDLLNSDRYTFRLTTIVDGIMYQSIPLDGKTLRGVLEKPPAGLEGIESMAKDDFTRGKTWRLLWTES